MTAKLCRRGDCARPFGHHGHCHGIHNGLRFWRSFTVGKPECPAQPGTFSDDCAQCEAEIDAFLATQARAAAAIGKAR